MSIKNEIIEAGWRLYSAGLVAANDGNISAKNPDGTIWTTPAGVSKGFMGEGDLVLLDDCGNVLSGSLKPSSEIKMHIMIYRENPEISAVVHAHPPAATAFACAGLPLDRPVLQEAVISLGSVPLVPYAETGSEELARSVASYCGWHRAVLMEHHGATAWGESVMQALFRMEGLEHYAKILLHMRTLGSQKTMSSGQVGRLETIGGYGL